MNANRSYTNLTTLRSQSIVFLFLCPNGTNDFLYMFASSESATFNQTQPLNPVPSTNPGNTRSTTTNPQLGVQPAPSQKQSGPLLPYFSSSWERTTPLPPSQTSLIVYPTQPLEEALRRIERNRFSRSHRQLFLIIDGQRSMLELARLVGKNQEDLQALLRDLERIGVIQP